MAVQFGLDIREKWAKQDAIRDAGLTTPQDITRCDDICYGPYGEENMLDVYYPKGTNKPLPTIISIHGGGWVYGDKQLYQHYCMRLAQRGFAVVNFTYRLAPENKYPAPIEDTFAVFNWVKENHQSYNIDYNNIFLVGDSAGGQLAYQISMILSNKSYAKKLTPKAPEGFTVNAVGLNCGHYTFDLKFPFYKAAKGALISEYLPKVNYKYVSQLNIDRYISNSFPPAFVMTSYEDFLYDQALPLVEKLKAKKVEAEYHVYGEKGNRTIGHVFHVNCRLEEAERCNDDECDFFRKHLK